MRDAKERNLVTDQYGEWLKADVLKAGLKLLQEAGKKTLPHGGTPNEPNHGCEYSTGLSPHDGPSKGLYDAG